MTLALGTKFLMRDCPRGLAACERCAPPPEARLGPGAAGAATAASTRPKTRGWRPWQTPARLRVAPAADERRDRHPEAPGQAPSRSSSAPGGHPGAPAALRPRPPATRPAARAP